MNKYISAEKKYNELIKKLKSKEEITPSDVTNASCYVNSTSVGGPITVGQIIPVRSHGDGVYVDRFQIDRLEE